MSLFISKLMQKNDRPSIKEEPVIFTVNLISFLFLSDR